MKVLVLNSGSSSVKYELWETSPEAIAANSDTLIKRGNVERVDDIDQALHTVFDDLGALSVDAVGHRIVHGGAKYTASVLVDAQVEKDIEDLGELAPLHNPHNLAGVRAAQRRLPSARHVGSVPPLLEICHLPPDGGKFCTKTSLLPDSCDT